MIFLILFLFLNFSFAFIFDTFHVQEQERKDLIRFHENIIKKLDKVPGYIFPVTKKGLNDKLGAIALSPDDIVYSQAGPYQIIFALPSNPKLKYAQIYLITEGYWQSWFQRDKIYLAGLTYQETGDKKFVLNSNNETLNVLYQYPKACFYSLPLYIKLKDNKKYRVLAEFYANNPNRHRQTSWQRFKNWLSKKKIFGPVFTVLIFPQVASDIWFINHFGGEVLKDILNGKFLYSAHVFPFFDGQLDSRKIFKSRSNDHWKKNIINFSNWLKQNFLNGIRASDDLNDVIDIGGCKARPYMLGLALSESGYQTLEMLGKYLSSAATSIMRQESDNQVKAEGLTKVILENYDDSHVTQKNKLSSFFFSGDSKLLDVILNDFIEDKIHPSIKDKTSQWLKNIKSNMKYRKNDPYGLSERSALQKEVLDASFPFLAKELKVLVLGAVQLIWLELKSNPKRDRLRELCSGALNSVGHKFSLMGAYLSSNMKLQAKAIKAFHKKKRLTVKPAKQKTEQPTRFAQIIDEAAIIAEEEPISAGPTETAQVETTKITIGDSNLPNITNISHEIVSDPVIKEDKFSWKNLLRKKKKKPKTETQDDSVQKSKEFSLFKKFKKWKKKLLGS